MKYIYFFLFLSCQIISSQVKGDFSIEISNWQFAASTGSITNRITNKHFEKIGFSADLYFPFYFAIRKNDSLSKNILGDKNVTKANHVFFFRQYVSYVFNESKGNFAMGFGNQFSFGIIPKLFIDYELGISWSENLLSLNSSGLRRGLSFRHFVVLKKTLSKRFDVGLGFMHLSDGDFFSNKTNYDMTSLRIYYSF